jgi:hypothetical protein
MEFTLYFGHSFFDRVGLLFNNRKSLFVDANPTQADSY